MAINAAAMMPIIKAAFSAASDVILLLLLFFGGVGIGGNIGGGCRGGGSVISVVGVWGITVVDLCVTTLLAWLVSRSVVDTLYWTETVTMSRVDVVGEAGDVCVLMWLVVYSRSVVYTAELESVVDVTNISSVVTGSPEPSSQSSSSSQEGRS